MALTLSLRFPAGRYTAAAWDDKDRAEWPPHPARLLLGLTDVLHKTGNPDVFRSALAWLCEQGAPCIVIPGKEDIDLQRMDGFYVPQNPSVAESPKHPRKPRSFPTVFLDPDQATVFFHWPEAEPSASVFRGLSDMIPRLPRFGHSSSLVVASVNEASPPAGPGWQRLLPVTDDTVRADFRLRVPYADLLEAAETAFAADAREKEMSTLIQSAAKSAKPEKPLKPAASPRGRYDARHRWHGYASEIPPSIPTTPWDNRVMLLARCDGPRAGLESTWRVIDAFHKTILDRWCRDPNRGPVPSWVSGHRPGNGTTAPARDNHLAFFPVADVRHAHAQGRLMGIGLAFPRPQTAGMDPVKLRLDWQKAMASLFPQGETLSLVSPSGDPLMTLQPADPTESRKSFQPSRWTGPATSWSSVTPVVMDRHPKPDFKKDPEAWKENCRQIILAACRRLELPAPAQIDVSLYSIGQVRL